MLALVARQLDRVRSPLVGTVLGHSAVLRRIAVDRRARLACGVAIALALALATSVLAPTAAFLWAPLVLGIPHVIADARYLLLAPYRRIPLRARDSVLAVAALAIAVVTAPWLGAAVVVGAVALTPTTRPLRCFAVLIAALALACAAWASPILTAYALMHGHNLVALAILVALAPRTGALLALGALAITAAIFAGAFDFVAPSVDAIAGYVLPDRAFDSLSPIAATRLALSFLFLQSVHYAVWLRLIPATLRPHDGMRGFGASLRALQRDVPGIAIFVALAVALPALAFATSALEWRMLYVQLVGGHAYLELAVLARWLAR